MSASLGIIVKPAFALPSLCPIRSHSQYQPFHSWVQTINYLPTYKTYSILFIYKLVWSLLGNLIFFYCAFLHRTVQDKTPKSKNIERFREQMLAQLTRYTYHIQRTGSLGIPYPCMGFGKGKESLELHEPTAFKQQRKMFTTNCNLQSSARMQFCANRTLWSKSLTAELAEVSYMDKNASCIHISFCVQRHWCVSWQKSDLCTRMQVACILDSVTKVTDVWTSGS